MNRKVFPAVLSLSVLATQLPLGVMASEMEQAAGGLVATGQDGSVVGVYSTVSDALASPDVYTVTLGSDVYTLSSDTAVQSWQTVKVLAGAELKLVTGESGAYGLMEDSNGSVLVFPGGKLTDPSGSTWLGGPEAALDLNDGTATLNFQSGSAPTVTLSGQPQVAPGQLFQPELLGSPITVELLGTDMDVYGTLNVFDSPGILKTPSLFSLNVRGNGYVHLKEDRENIHGQITVWDNSATFKYGTTTIFG